MKNHFICKSKTLFISVLLFTFSGFCLFAQIPEITITLHIRGVYETNISLLGQSGSRMFKPFTEVKGITNGETTRVVVSKVLLPGEFVLRFDYKEKATSTLYPSEKYIFINDQDLELWVSPIYCNNSDSTWFQEDERENKAFTLFSAQNGKRKEQLGLLQNFLLNYDDTESEFYQQGITEYENRRQNYNQWLADRIQKDKALFVSNMYQFEYLPEILWKGSESDRIRSLIKHYFDATDFDDPLLIKISGLNKWMDNYVNLYGELSTTVALRDSLIPEAGKTAIEKAKKGNPLVYGWMVDYFYKGFESNSITSGMKILEPYLNDPNCMTSKRVEIERRLKGIKTLIPGSRAPNISLKKFDGKLFDLYTSETQGNYTLILFWSAGCSHCVEMVDKLYPWQQQKEILQKIDVVAIGLDETEPEIKRWKNKITELNGWNHLSEPLGVSSKVANDYYVLSTPVMILLNARTKDIVAVPNTIQEIINAIK